MLTVNIYCMYFDDRIVKMIQADLHGCLRRGIGKQQRSYQSKIHMKDTNHDKRLKHRFFFKSTL